MNWDNIQELMRKTLFTIAGTPVNLTTVLVFILILVGAAVISRVAQRAIRRVLALRKVTDEGSVGVITRLTHYVIMLIGIGIGFQTLGINLTALFTAGAVFAIALGFAMQNIAQNFVAGLILLSERSIKPGDILEVDGQLVRVFEMGIRATMGRTRDDEDLIIPNGNLVQSTVKNYTFRDSSYRIRALVGVAYATDLEHARTVLLEAAGTIPGRTASKDPVVLLVNFGDSSIELETSIWVDDPWVAKMARSELNLAIWRSLKKAGITIAFPQLDLHLDPEVAGRLAGRGGDA